MMGIIENVGTLRKRLAWLTAGIHMRRRAIVGWSGILGAIAISALLSCQLATRGMVVAGKSAGSTQPAGQQLSGRVMDVEGRPVAGATVCLVVGNPDESVKVFIATTGDDGRFSLPASSAVSDRPPTLFAFAPGVGFSKSLRRQAGDVGEVRLRRAVDVQLTCLDPNGKPLAGFHVAPARIQPVGWEDTLREGYLDIPQQASRQLSVSTDASGKCTFHGLPEHARIRFASDDPRFAEMTYEDGIISEGAVPITAQAHLANAGSIEGTVVDPETHRPRPGILLCLQGTNDNPSSGSGPSASDAAGHYRFSRVRAGSYVVSMRSDLSPGGWTAPAALVTLADGQNAVADLTLTHGGFVKGQVRDGVTGKPISGMSIGLYGPAKPRSAAAIFSADSDSQGNYAIRTPAGKQYVYLAQEPPAGYLPPSTAAFEPDVLDGQMTVVNFDLQPDNSPIVTGTVFDPSGHPVSGAIVSYENPISALPESGKSTQTDAAGHFELRGAEAGAEFRVRAQEESLATELPVTLPQPARDLTIRLSTRVRFALAAIVTDADGAIIPGTTVQLGMNHGSFGIGDVDRPASADGVVSFEGLWTDRHYYLWATAPGYGVTQTIVETPTADHRGRQTETMVLTKATSVIAGVVVDAEGQPAPGIMVSINDSRTGVLSVQTDSNGRFSFSVPDDASNVVVFLRRAAGDTAMPVSKMASAGQTDVKLILRAAAHR